MRRQFAAAALIGAFLLTGCSDDPSGGPAGAGTPPPAPGPSAAAPVTPGATGGSAAAGDAALRGNTRAICDQAAKTGGDFATIFAQNLKLQIDAAGTDNPAAVQQAKEKAARDVQSYSYALNDMAKLAADPAVSKALAAMSKQVTALKGDLAKLDAAKLAELRATLDKACGNA